MLDGTSKLYSLLGLEWNGRKSFAAELSPEGGRVHHHSKHEPPYISTWVDPGATWAAQEDLAGEDGTTIPDGTRVCIMAGAEDRTGHRRATTRERVFVAISRENARPTDQEEWSAVEYRILLDAVRPGEPFQQLGVCANMRGHCTIQI